MLDRPDAAEELAKPFDLRYCASRGGVHVAFVPGAAQETVGAAAACFVTDWSWNCDDRPYIFKTEVANKFIQGERYGDGYDTTPAVFDPATEASFRAAGYEFETPQWRIDRRNHPDRTSRKAPGRFFEFELWEC